ncbi:hypothetical protein [Streptomyces sp. C8S0]|uniref:hypothetical protein n=1 Tax=Streptomyces sp. C8S0 TaxID=2585716 RepID=UPI001D03C090|nr:hypothetical protein [Streptomyces sp. C8S0]
MSELPGHPGGEAQHPRPGAPAVRDAEGDVVTDGWQSEEVHEALDLCLACKGCTNDCPVNVDMPTYKAEFLYHHFKSARRWRPRHAYAFGFIDQAVRIAARAPGWRTSRRTRRDWPGWRSSWRESTGAARCPASPR